MVIAINMGFMLFLGLLLGSDLFGEFTLLWACIMTVQALVSLGGPPYLLKELSTNVKGGKVEIDALQGCFIIILGPALLTAFVFSVMSGIAWFGKSGSLALSYIDVEMVTLVAVASFLVNLIQHLSVLMRAADMQHAPMILGDAGPQLCALIAVLIWLTMGYGAVAQLLVIFSIVAAATTLIAFSLFSLLAKDRFAVKRFAVKKAKGSILQLRAFWFATVIGCLSSQVDILVAGSRMNASDIGVYQLLKKYSNLAAFPQLVSNWAFTVKIGRAFGSDNKRQVALYCREGQKLAFLPGIVLLFVLLFFLPDVSNRYAVEVSGALEISFVVLLAVPFVNLFCGLNNAVAQQSGLVRYTAYGRVITVLSIVFWATMASHDLSILDLSLIYATSACVSQLYVAVMIVRKLRLNTTATSLFGHNPS